MAEALYRYKEKFYRNILLKAIEKNKTFQKSILIKGYEFRIYTFRDKSNKLNYAVYTFMEINNKYRWMCLCINNNMRDILNQLKLINRKMEG